MHGNRTAHRPWSLVGHRRSPYKTLPLFHAAKVRATARASVPRRYNMSNTPNSVTFHDGRTAPQLGFGVWQIENESAPAAVGAALDAGYRLIDTAAAYNNEQGVGQAIAKAGINRDALFVTTKLWNNQHGHDKAVAAFDSSLDRLGLDYIDLYLIHWPVPKQKLYIKAWEALIRLRDEGRAKSIGVCNFNIAHLQKLLDQTGVLPVVNQIELHPHFQQAELREFHAEHDIVTEAWSPLGRRSEEHTSELQ